MSVKMMKYEYALTKPGQSQVHEFGFIEAPSIKEARQQVAKFSREYTFTFKVRRIKK